jgi:tyrosyl-tRNA synthetase
MSTLKWRNFMKIYEELKFRGITAQVTNEEKIENIINNKKITFYVGCDPTADSLHVGHLVQLFLVSRLQKNGHTPICLFGGGTGFIGDPSGKNSMRKLMPKEQIEYNVECFKKQMSKFLDVSNIIFVNNADWLCDLNYINFLRDIGTCFSVNKMLAAECYKQRLQEGLTFFELNYMIMQAYDFLHLNKKYNCILQIGGNDQWSNMIAGVELLRKKNNTEVFALTTNLLTKSDGKKMGKTENGAIWLDPEKTSPYDFYQYWRNIQDTDVIKCVKVLTDIDVNEIIKQFENLKGQELNEVKKILAYNLTKKIHGEIEADKCKNSAEKIFASGDFSSDIPTKYVNLEKFKEDKIKIIDLIFEAKVTSSKSEARRLVEQNGISINNKTADLNFCINKNNLENGIILKKGKKNYFKILKA